MKATKTRSLRSGSEFDRMFPPAKGERIVIRQDAVTNDTLALIQQVVASTLDQTKEVAKHLKGKSLRETCQNIFDFCYTHIQYREDRPYFEEVRTPAKTWQDRHEGVDCDCYTTFISSILSNLKIPHTLRVTKYDHKNYYQHIYVVVPVAGNFYFTIDPVVDRFDYEVPFTDKKDIPMDLHLLNGPGGEYFTPRGGYDDDETMEGSLGLFKKRNKASAPSSPPKNKKEGLKKGAHAVNRFNPATALVRTGILAAMRLNIGKLAGKLRHGYLSEAEAQKRGYNMGKFKKVKEALAKLQNIFYVGGGKPENLKKAILSGKGNKDKEVALSGFGIVGESNFNENSPAKEVLGLELYNLELVKPSLQGLNGLGDPAIAVALTAASGVIFAISQMIKGVGGLKDGKAESPDEAINEADIARYKKGANAGSTVNPGPANENSMVDNGANERNAIESGEEGDGGDDSTTPPKKGFLPPFKGNEIWYVLGGGALLLAAFFGIRALMRRKKSKELKGTPTLGDLKGKLEQLREKLRKKYSDDSASSSKPAKKSTRKEKIEEKDIL